ncbi:hypothetical protein CLPU_2c00330 [Gottschalkia purinilytica]|uniref:Spore coat protein n=1 Tax=Gottschalkia purinilytica TaxID=1503 RepID=A0A0L0WDN0_GOTPU|nr:hypothetical protein [Gottschalkia purinilytica]KNF09582.1 hypothetical protein CLPU_2c00330 [Gottschalkia purinilytica]
MLDEKSISLVKEQLNNEYVLYKKYLNYSNMIFDSELKNICYESSLKHKDNYQSIVSYLDSLKG